MDLEREKGITIKARAVRLEYDAQRRPDLRPQPHRHARSRRLRLRGQPQPAGLRGRDPRRRRDPGHRGPDARQRPPRPARGPHPHPGPQQDRPPVGGPRDDHGRAGERAGHPARGGHPRVGQGRHGRRRRSSRRSSPASRRPRATRRSRLQGLIFDSHYDAYKGVVVYVRLAQGTLRSREPHPPDGRAAPKPSRSSWASSARSSCRSTGSWRARSATSRRASRTSARRRSATRVTTVAHPAAEPLPGYQEAKSLVFAGIYPVSGEDYPLMREALEKLHLNDAELHLRAGELRGARVRLSLRLPGPPPHGDRPGAPRARVRPRPHRLGAVRRVPRQPDARPRRGHRRQPGPAARPRRHRDHRGAVGQAQRRHAEPVHRLAHGAVARTGAGRS